MNPKAPRVLRSPGVGISLAAYVVRVGAIPRNFRNHDRPLQSDGPERQIGLAWRRGTGRRDEFLLFAQWVTFNLGRARFKQYCLLPTVIRQMSDETPPDNGSQLNCSAIDSRPMRLIVSQIDSRVSGSATEPDGFIDKHFELGERTTAQGMAT